ncbi:MAG: paraquat-inducible protein A [Limisphaerales bacterium]
MLTTITAGGSESDTIMQGVVLLWSPTGWPLSLIVLFASIMIPEREDFGIGLSAHHGEARLNPEQRPTRAALPDVEIIGRWSMVDVFVDTFTVSLIQLQPLMSVEPGPGLLFFAAVVVLTMMAVESFDPRLIWIPPARKKFNERCNMPDNEKFPPVPDAKAVPKKRTRISLVWVIPIIAAVAGAWIA